MGSFIERYGPWALITGASSGIGAEFASQLGRAGLNIILVARREDYLSELAAQLSQQYNIEAVPIVQDLTDATCLESVQSRVGTREIGLLINNAGFSITGSFTRNPLLHEQHMLDINCRTPMMFTHHFGQQMLARRRGGIIFVSSSVAFSPVPLWSHYSATKAYVRFLAEGLWHEFKSQGVDVLALCPGSTKTEFQVRAEIRTAPFAMSADVVVSQAIRALGRHPVLVPGLSNRLIAALSQLVPERVALSVWSKVMEKLRLKPNLGYHR